MVHSCLVRLFGTHTMRVLQTVCVLVLVALGGSLSAAVSSEGTLTLELVDKSGTTPNAMDYGGVWNGTQVTTSPASPTAHTLTLRIENTGDEAINGLTTTLALPTGFTTLSNTRTGRIGLTNVTSSITVGALSGGPPSANHYA